MGSFVLIPALYEVTININEKKKYMQKGIFHLKKKIMHVFIRILKFKKKVNFKASCS